MLPWYTPGLALNCNTVASTWQINCLPRSQRVKDSRKSIVFIFIMIFVLANYAIVAFEVEKLRSTGLKLVMTICILMCVACCYNYHLCFILYNRGIWLNTMRKIKNLDDSRYIPRWVILWDKPFCPISTRFPWKKSALYLPDKKAEFVII